MRKRGDLGLLLPAALLLALAVPACGGDGGSSFCGEWATAFCHRIWACDPAGNPLAGPSESECARGYGMLCAMQQPAGQTFDVSCYGKQVNETAKAACLNKLNTVSCEEFNGPTYDDDCDLVCTTGGGTGGTTGTGGTSGGGCGSTQPCGGDIVGAWSITDVCVGAPPPGDPSCPGDTISNVMITETGTLTFVSGGSYSASINATQSYTEVTPSSCISPATCADLAAAYQSLGASATCSGTTTCTCMIAVAISGSATGTYTTSGSTLTITGSTSTEPDSMGYCVQGNTVHFLHFNSAGQVTTDETGQRL